MANIKTTASLPESVFAQAETLERDLSVLRGRPVVFSLEDSIREYEDARLFEQINRACENDPPDETEQQYLRQSLRLHRRLVKGKW